MSRTIWKYELAATDVQKVSMPPGAQLLHVAGQEVREWTDQGARAGVFPMLWALVDPDEGPPVERLIGIVGTGNPAPDIPDQAVYIGSAICGPLVWHIFDGGELPSGGGRKVTGE